MKERPKRSGAVPAALGPYARHIDRAAQAAFEARQYDAANALTSVRRCGADVTVWRMDDGSFDYTPAYCERKLCTHCAYVWAKRLQARATAAVRSIPPRDLRHLVLTIANPPAGRLGDDFDRFKTAFRIWRCYGRKQNGPGYWRSVHGSLAKLEIHLSPNHTWHPHYHLLIHTPNGIDFQNGSPARESWVRTCRNHGLRACFKNGAYIKQPKDAPGVAAEVAKYSTKPISLEHLAAHPRGDHYLRELAQTFQAAMVLLIRHAHLLRSGPGAGKGKNLSRVSTRTSRPGTHCPRTATPIQGSNTDRSAHPSRFDGPHHSFPEKASQSNKSILRPLSTALTHDETRFD